MSRGFNESFIYWGWSDIDMFYRLAARFRFADLEDSGVATFHLEHYSGQSARVSPSELDRKRNTREIPTEFAPNSDAWGLADESSLASLGHSLPRPGLETARTMPDSIDTAYFNLLKIGRFLDTALLVVDANPLQAPQLANMRAKLQDAKSSIFEVATQWFRYRANFENADYKRRVHDELRQGTDLIVLVFNDPVFQATWAKRDQILGDR